MVYILYTMKIAYIILTCEKYLPTRAQWVLEHSLGAVESRDLYFLSGPARTGETSIYGWGTPDNYEGCPMKYIAFFQNMELDYDWYFFMDDDTFVSTDRLAAFVQELDATQSLYIGNICNHLSYPVYMSGGAGFLLSRPLYTALCQYMREMPASAVPQDRHGDLSMGLWLTPINKQVMDKKELFYPGMYKNGDDLSKAISFHYLKEEGDYQLCKTLLRREAAPPFRTHAL
jgi:hypothetical protein